MVQMSDNPLDRPFSASRAQESTPTPSQPILEISDSALQHITLGTIGNLARVAERYSEAIKYFPTGSRLLLSADGERGNAWENGYLRVYCELRYPVADGKFKTSGREFIASSESEAINNLETFLKKITGKSQD